MSLQFFGSNDAKPRHYKKPEEVLGDVYLTPLQKNMVLEALLSEAEEDNHRIGYGRYVDKIHKAKAKLENQLF